VKSVSKLLGAAFALAAIASVATPFAQPAQAVNGPDINVFVAISPSGNGGVKIDTGVQNLGNTKSQIVHLIKFCGYLDDGNNVNWVAQGLPQVIPGIDAGHPADPIDAFTCKVTNGNHPVAARVSAANAGDVNLSNNDVKKETFAISMPPAPPNQAGFVPDIKVNIQIEFGGNGGVLTRSAVENLGKLKSQTVHLVKYCGYLNDASSVSWAAQGLPQVIPGIDGQSTFSDVEPYTCKVVNGNHPVAARVSASTVGDLNPANNDRRIQTFSLK
jgi:hypothetical protein